MIGNYVYIFAVLLGLLQLVDFITTRRALFLGCKEANPIMKWIFGKLNYDVALVITKIAGTAAGVVLAWLSGGVIGPELFALWVLIAIYVGIAVNNTAVLKEM
jgi:hypothetical protein